MIHGIIAQPTFASVVALTAGAALATDSAQRSDDPVSYDTAVYDEIGAHDPASPTLLTVPEGATLVRHSFGNFHQNDPVRLYGNHNNAATKEGLARSYTGGATGYYGQNACSAPLVVAKDDTFRVRRDFGWSYAGTANWQQLEVLDPTKDRALVVKGADQAFSAAATWDVQSWGSAVYDTGGFFDAATNDTRFTIPEDGLYRVSFGAFATGHSSQFFAHVILNGASATGLPIGSNNYHHNNECSVSLMSAPMSLTAGDYLEARCLSQNGAGVVAANSAWTWFAIERLPDDHKYCLVAKSNAQSTTTSNPEITFNTEVHDPLGMFSPTASRITIPAGYTRARAICAIGQQGNNGKTELTITKTGSNSGRAVYTTESPYAGRLQAHTAWMEAAEGDQVYANLYSSLFKNMFTDINTNWFCVELL